MSQVEAMDTVNKFLTVKAAAARLNVSRQLLYRLVGDGHVAAVRIAGCVRLPAEEVARLEREGTAGSVVSPGKGAEA